MPDQRRRPRGWHLHPGDPTSVRYWDGDGWQRVRDRPAWSLSVGELIVDVEGRVDTTKPRSDPAIEGPARPAAERTTTGVLGVGAEPHRPNRQPSPLRSSAATHGPRAGQFPSLGAAHDAGTGAPWEGSRRPLVLFGVIVVVAIVLMVATVGWSRSRAVDLNPLPSSFVAYASRTCAATLGTVRPSALPGTPAAITTQDDQLDALAGELRSLAITTDANPQASGWLAAWGRYTADERQRATALSAKPAAPAAAAAGSAQISAPPAGTMPAGQGTAMTGASPAVLANQALTAADHADSFATTNDLQSCAILAQGSAGTQSIPS